LSTSLDTVLLPSEHSSKRLRPIASIVKAENMSSAHACTFLRGNAELQLFAFAPATAQ
jgi:hypothetical protein